jgi:hypothetical protein
MEHPVRDPRLPLRRQGAEAVRQNEIAPPGKHGVESERVAVTCDQRVDQGAEKTVAFLRERSQGRPFPATGCDLSIESLQAGCAAFSLGVDVD